MRILTKSSLPLAALLFALVLMPTSGWAGGPETQNCPKEPATNVSIVSGETYWGTNCVLNTTGDVDSFQFKASAGETWTMAAGLGPKPPTNINLFLYAPGSTTPIFSGGSILAAGVDAVSTVQKLAVSGVYTIVITEASSTTVTYGLSLEQLSPAPPDAIPLALAHTITGEINPPTAHNVFTFKGSTSGTYKIVLNFVPGILHDVCFQVYQPDGTNVVNYTCTIIAAGVVTVSADVTPAQNCTYVVLITEAGQDGTVNYNLDVSCLLGTCATTPPRCILDDEPTYNGTTGTLTMTFYLETPVAVTWNGWLTSHNTIQPLWSQSQPITKSPTRVVKTHAMAKAGEVGILSTLTTSTGGITCSSWQTVNTGP